MSNGSDQPNPPTGSQLPDGFGFNPGELIPTAPYVFPGEQDLVYLLEFVGELNIPYISVIADIIEVILELIDELVAIFTGKPRSLDTLTVAQRLGRGANPIAHIMSTQISRNLQQNNIVLSSSNASDQTILGEIRGQAKRNLVAAGATEARATHVVDQVWNNTSSATEPLPPEFSQALPAGLTMVGTTAMQAAYVTHYNADIQKGLDPSQAAQKAYNWLLTHSKLGDLGKMSVQPLPPPITQPPLPPPPSPPPPPPPPPPTQPGGQPCFPTQNPQGDELTDGLGCVSQNLAILATYANAMLAQMAAEASGTLDPCCAAIVAQLTALSTALTGITSIGGGGGGAGGGSPDLDAITTALQGIKADLDALATAAEPANNAVAQALTGPITEALNALSMAPGPTVPAPSPTPTLRAFISSTATAWVADGTMDAADAQVLIGS